MVLCFILCSPNSRRRYDVFELVKRRHKKKAKKGSKKRGVKRGVKTRVRAVEKGEAEFLRHKIRTHLRATGLVRHHVSSCTITYTASSTAYQGLSNCRWTLNTVTSEPYSNGGCCSIGVLEMYTMHLCSAVVDDCQGSEHWSERGCSFHMFSGSTKRCTIAAHDSIIALSGLPTTLQ